MPTNGPDTPSDLVDHTQMAGRELAVESIKLSSGEMLVVRVDGEPWVLFSRAMELLGLNAEAQLRRVRRQPWAAVRYAMVQLDDDRPRRTVACDEPTFLGHVFNIDANRVTENRRAALRAFQCESVRALAGYWTRGVAVNPRGPVVEVMDELHRAHVARQVVDGRRDGDRATARKAAWRHLDRAYRLALDAGLGVHNALPPTDR